MAILGKLNEWNKNRPEVIQPTPPDVKQGKEVADNPAEVKLTPLTKEQIEQYPEAQRNNYMQSFGSWEDAEKAGTIAQRDWAKAKIDQMVAKGENPGSYLNLLSMIGEAETPEEKRKRERREAVGEAISGLGNLIGNVANLYYAPRSGYSIDLNTAHEKHRDRLQRLKEKQDALAERRNNILLNAKIGDVKAERDAALKVQLQNMKDKQAQAAERQKAKDAQIKYLYDLGLIDAREAAELAKMEKKHEYDKALEGIRQNNKISLKQTPSYGQDKVLTSLTGSNGQVYTRNSKLSDVEVRQLAKYVEDWEPYTTVDEDGNKTVDYIGAVADAAESGMIPNSVLEDMGMKTDKKGFSYGNKSSKGYSFK